MSETETLVQKHMRLLGISEEEAKALIEADKAIDKGEKMDFDLTPEQAKKYNADKETKKIEKIILSALTAALLNTKEANTNGKMCMAGR